MSMKKSICTHCYHQDNCPVDPNYKAERAPTIITTCTDYEPDGGLYVQCQSCQYYLLGTCAYYEQPLDHYPDEDITCTDYKPAPDYYEQGSQSVLIDEFTEALLDWLETPKSK